MIFSNIKQLFNKNKKTLAYAGIFFVLFTLLGDGVFAAEGDAAETAGWIDKAMMALAAIVGVFTYLITLFLEPTWTNGTIFGLDEKFRDIWILVSNVVYFIFAFLLIWIAFMNIIGKGDDKYQLKQALPKFVIGVLIVPFSWFFVQFVLSLSAILTVSSLSLPSDTFSQYEQEISEIKIPQDCVFDISNSGDDETGNKWFKCEEEPSVSLKDTMLNSSFGLISMYSYGILKLDEIDSIKLSDVAEGKIKDVGDLIIHIFFNILFVIIYMILMIALGLVLAVRGIYLWLYIILSPVFGLMYFFGKDGAGDGFFAKFNVKEFISLALVPVYVTLALSFGFLFLHVVSTGMSAETSGDTQKISINGDKLTIIDAVGDKNINITMSGAIGVLHKADSTKNFLYNVGSDGLGIIGTLIIQIFGAVVFWIAIMSALRSSDITKAIVEPIHGFGTQVGGLMAKAPQYAPIFPGGQSMQSMSQVAGKVQGSVNQSAIDKANNFSKNVPFLNAGAVDRSAKLQTVTNRLKTNYGSSTTPTESLREEFLKILKAAGGDANNMVNSRDFKDALVELAKRAGVDPKDFKFNSKQAIADTVIRPIEGAFDAKTLGLLDGIGSTSGNLGAKGLDDLVANAHANEVQSVRKVGDINFNISRSHIDESGQLIEGREKQVAQTIVNRVPIGQFTKSQLIDKLKEELSDSEIERILPYLEDHDKKVIDEGIIFFKENDE